MDRFTFDSYLPDDQLRERVRQLGRMQADAGQVARRLKKLLPRRLDELVKEKKASTSAMRARRHALIDPRFDDHVTEYLELAERAHQARVLWETHVMLSDCRRSTRSGA